jgi:hypothetical protein
MVQFWRDIATIAAACVTAGSAMIALFAYWTSRAAYSANRENQQEALVQKAYYDYAKMTVDHPDLAFPPRSALDYEKETLNGSELKFEKYEWFLSAMLVTVHFVMKIRPDNEFWKTLTTNQISYHWQYLDLFWDKKPFIKNWRTTLGPQMREGINRGREKFQPAPRTLIDADFDKSG